MKNFFVRLFFPAPLGRIPASLDKNSEFQLEVSSSGKLSIVRTMNNQEVHKPLGITAAKALSVKIEEIFDTEHYFITRYKDESEYLRVFTSFGTGEETFRILFLRSEIAKIANLPE